MPDIDGRSVLVRLKLTYFFIFIGTNDGFDLVRRGWPLNNIFIILPPGLSFLDPYLGAPGLNVSRLALPSFAEIDPLDLLSPAVIVDASTGRCVQSVMFWCCVALCPGPGTF